MKGDKIVHIWCDLYKSNIYFYIGGNVNDAWEYYAKQIKLKGPYDKEDIIRGLEGKMMAMDNSVSVIVWLNKDYTFQILVHECLHVTNFLFKQIGILPATHDNDEHYCYFLQWLIEKFLDKVKPNNLNGIYKNQT